MASPVLGNAEFYRVPDNWLKFEPNVGMVLKIFKHPFRFLILYGQKLTFIVKSVYSVNTGAFMVSTKQEKVFWIFDFVGQQQADGFQRLLPSVDIISEKQIVAFRWKSTVFEQSQKIVILSVNIS